MLQKHGLPQPSAAAPPHPLQSRGARLVVSLGGGAVIRHFRLRLLPQVGSPSWLGPVHPRAQHRDWHCWGPVGER